MAGVSRLRLAIYAGIAFGAFAGIHWGLLDAGQRAHAWERFAIHFFCAAAVAQMIRAGLHGMELLRWIRTLGPRMWFWLPVLIVPLLLFLREPGDVAAGGPLAKSYLDPAGWALGAFADRCAAGWLAPRVDRARRSLDRLKGL